jgi:hypothetical protein
MAAKLPSHNSSDFKSPDNFEIDLSSTLDEIERPDLAVVTDADLETPHVKEYNFITAFMEDMLTIRVAESEDPYAPNPVSAGNNGIIKLFTRGETYRVARKFVDSLIKTSFRTRTVQYKDANGLDQTKIEQIPVHNVIVQVIEDPAGDYGRKWLEYKMSTAS